VLITRYIEYEIFDEIHQTWRRAEGDDDAIAAKREAIAAGFRSVPDPETGIAECLLAAGRREEADAPTGSPHQPDAQSRSWAPQRPTCRPDTPAAAAGPAAAG
jgi:hypothetical protein